MTETVMSPPTILSRRAAAVVLIAAGVMSILAALFLGLNGIQSSESFGVKDLKQVQGGMHLYRIDLKAWPEPPFLVIDDARHGDRGTQTELTIDGTPVGTGRASRPVLIDPGTAAYLHTGVGNIYVSPGPEATPDSRFKVTFTVRLDTSIWASAAVFAALVVLGGLFLWLGVSIVFDVVLAALTLALAAALWLNFTGVDVERPLDVTDARKLEPNGYLTRMPRIGPLIIPATDRSLPEIRGQLLQAGKPVGNPLALSPEIINAGDGAHLMSSRGAFYFSLPGNPGLEDTTTQYSVRVTYTLPDLILVFASSALAMVLIGGLAGGNSRLLTAARKKRPRMVAVAIPVAIATATGGYLAWLFWTDPLHMHGPPAEQDWFTPNEGWRMAGLVRTYPYRGIIVGTSVSQNFYMDEASDTLGMPVLNATMAGSVPAGQADLARLALERESTELVVWEIHVTSFTQPTDLRKPEFFPAHLYDANPLNDLEYYFSLQAWIDATAAGHARRGGQLKRLDPINKWGERMDFGPAVVAKTYCARRDRQASQVPLDAFAANLRTHVLPLVRANPESRFVLFIPAYPALMHLPVGGRMTGLERAAGILLDVMSEHPNVEVHDFQGIGPETGDPRLFRDDIHYHPTINSAILKGITAGDAVVTQAGLAAHEVRLIESFRDTASAFRTVMDPVCEEQAK